MAGTLCIIYSNLCHSFIPFVHSKTLSCCTTRTELGLILVFALEVLRISLEIPTDDHLSKVQISVVSAIFCNVSTDEISTPRRGG